jgi:glycosyltransferase involved in cell wall biosynthesis
MTQELRVYVHVAYGFSAESWNHRWKTGGLIGVNEPFAYGYQRAQKYGCKITYSLDYLESALSKVLRYVLRFLLGFDLVHAFRNRRAMLSADVVWTHTESQSLAVAAILMLRKRSLRPKTILQSVWLIDRWRKFSPLHKALYKHLLSSADVLTFLSSVNAEVARQIFVGKRVEHIMFGINADTWASPTRTAATSPIKVLSVGNDADRDWATLRDALAGEKTCEFKIVTTRLPKTYLTGNGEVVQVENNDELFAYYRWADICVVPLKSNLHASGITAVQEAAIRGVPVVCTDTGGLTDYFNRDEVRYVPLCDPGELRKALLELAGDADHAGAIAERAQYRMKNGGLNSESFAKRHVDLSIELLGRS